VLCARKFIGHEPFAVLLGDDIIRSEKPTLKSMIEVYDRLRTSVIGAMEVPHEEVDRYGIISPEEKNGIIRIRDLVEKPRPEDAPSNLAVIGRYIIEPEIFSLLERALPGKGGEIQLTDALRELNRQKQMVAYRLEGTRYDIGDKLGYIKATVDLALTRPDLREQVKRYLLELTSNWKE